MTTPRYHVELSSNEHLLLVYALGHIVPSIAVRFYADEEPADSLGLLAKLCRVTPLNVVPRAPNPSPEPPGRSRAESRPAVPETHAPADSDPMPEGSKELTVQRVERIQKSQDGKRLIVTWVGGQGAAWQDPKNPGLWPAVLKTVKEPATFYVIGKQSGGRTYINIVGVKTA